ncbi:M3 family metallopeptidase [Flavobacterium sp. ZT3R18]|uniref:M3 family metallopeptidase n=1 Tax=Flavobacterium sp. ZT3R18 TaxID=2594429 RepID=UPI00117ACB85|nr:M3 family metallopeptidase [Flavobacterium sp. ZT3R18]TRX35531.1 M3 family metallopeptidase [Flavobacterium sp. ZT3R18]
MTFQENGVFNKVTIKNCKGNVRSKGETEHPMILYKHLRAQRPKPDALLKRAGLV